MSQPVPPYERQQKFKKLLVRVAAIEFILLVGAVAAMASDIITVDQMLIAVIVIALGGGAAMSWSILATKRFQQEQANPGAVYDPGNSQEHGTGAATLGTATTNDAVNTLDESNAAEKFGDPNA